MFRVSHLGPNPNPNPVRVGFGSHSEVLVGAQRKVGDFMHRCHRDGDAQVLLPSEHLLPKPRCDHRAKQMVGSESTSRAAVIPFREYCRCDMPSST